MKKMFLAVLIGFGLIFTGCNSDIVDGSEDVVVPAEELGSVIDLPNGLRVEWQDDKYMTFDGMAFSKAQVQAMAEESSLRAVGVTTPSYRWSNREVPYRFANGLSDEFKMRVRIIWEEFHIRTCIRIREATSADRDYVLVTSENTGIWSYVGRQGGAQQLNLQDGTGGTFTSGDAIKAMMNTLGFYSNREVTRPDRDRYVTILWENLGPNAEDIFGIKQLSSQETDFGLPFDYYSVLSPGPYAYSKNGRPTVVSNNPDIPYVQAQRLSELDIISLHYLYGCY